MERRGLLKKRRMHSDGRSAALHITEKGVEAVAEAFPGILRVQGNILSRLPAALHVPFLRSLKHIVDSEERGEVTDRDDSNRKRDAGTAVPKRRG